MTTGFEMHEPTREELAEWDRQLVWHPFTQMAEYEPLIFTHGEGAYLWDIDGNRLLDGVSSIWCNLHGHRHRHLDAAAKAQLDRVAHTTNLGASNPTTIKLAKKLVDLTPGELNHVFFSDDGATSIEVALKMALQYWRQRPDPRPGKTRYLAFGDAYHGDTLGCVSVGGVARFHAMFEPLLFAPVRVPIADTFRLPEGVTAETAKEHYLKLVEVALAEHHEQLAAIIIEPLVQGAAGMVMHPPGFLAGLSALSKKYDVLLIADEVAVGMGRTGTMFACQQEDVVPDFLCLAKGLTGGYVPLSATITTPQIWNAFLGTYAESKSFFHGHTYGGNPLGAAIATATLEVFENEKIFETLPAKIEHLRQRLERFWKYDCVGDVRQRGMIAAVEMVKDRETKEPFPWGEKRGMRVCDVARQHGVYVRPLGNVLVIFPPLCVTVEQMDDLCDALEAGVAGMG